MPGTMRKHWVIIMNKKWYKLVFEQLDPIHIGKTAYGVISETRIFIPGWTMWGALVNSYAGKIGLEPDNFKEVQHLFERVTCFYPSFDNEGNAVLFPKFEGGELYLGADYPENVFGMEFTDTFVSTAINPVSLTAEEESLHEMEVILPKSKRNKRQIYWSGLIGIEAENIDKMLNFFEEGRLEITVGGDSRYGLGRLRLISKRGEDGEALGQWGINEKGELNIREGVTANYIEFSTGIHFLKGKTEYIIIEFNFQKAIPEVKESRLCIIPGSKIRNTNKNMELKKGVLLTVK